MKAVLDAGAFVAVEKRDRRLGAMLRVLERHRIPVGTSAGVIAQVWRDGRKQVLLARLLPGAAVRALAPDEDEHTGELLALAKTDDVIDAHLVLGVGDGDHVFTSDPDDIQRLLDARGVDAHVIRT